MIVDVVSRRVSAPLHTPFVTSLRRATTVETLVVEVVDSEGHRGYGEAPQVWQVTGASLAGSEACVESILGPLLRGRDPDDLVDSCRAVASAVVGNEAAKAALDVALHDLAAVRLGVPLVRLMGGTALRVLTDITLSAADPAALAEAATQRIAEGFTVVKAKVGLADDSPDGIAAEIDRVRVVRAAIGPKATLRLDANQGWTPRQAVRVIGVLEDAGLGVELVEQPVPRWDLDGLAWVSDRVRTPILADESVFGVRDLVEVIRRRAADMVNVKLAKCGGLSAARTLLSLAHEQGIGTIVGSMMEGPIGVGAAASLVAAYGTSAVSDLDAAWWLASSPVRGGLSYDGPYVCLPDAPGLGVNGVGDPDGERMGSD